MHGTLKVERAPSNPAEAIGRMKRHVEAYRDGGLDREAEDLEFGERFGLDPRKIKSMWAKARKDRAEKERLNGFTEVRLEDLPKPREPEEEAPDIGPVETVIAEVIAEPSPEPELRRRENEPVIRRRESEAAQPRPPEPEPEPKGPEPDEATAQPRPKQPEPEPTDEAKGPEAGKAGWPEAPVPPAGASATDRLTYPRGLVGHVTQYVEDTAELPNRWLSMATALSACAKGLDRKVLGPRANSVILWLLLLAETGAGKQHALNCLRILLRAMGIENVIAASGLGSVQGIEEILMGIPLKTDPQPNALVVIDEVGAWLSRISSKGQTGNVAEIPALLQSLWGWPPQLEWTGQKTKGKEMTPVHGPAFSLFGASTEGKFIKALTGDQVSNGFVNRMLLFNIGRGAEKRVKAKYDWIKFPGWLSKALRKVAGDPAPKGAMLLDLKVGDREPVVLRDFHRIGWGIGAEEHWQRYEDGMRGMSSAEERELWIRAPENALRLATIVAMFAGSSVVLKEDLEWSIAVVEYSMRQLVQALRKNMRQDLDQVDLLDKIRSEFLKKLRKGEPPRLTQGQIRKLCERLTGDHRKIDQAMDHLEKCGDVVELDREGRVGQPTREWEWQT